MISRLSRPTRTEAAALAVAAAGIVVQIIGGVNYPGTGHWRAPDPAAR